MNKFHISFFQKCLFCILLFLFGFIVDAFSQTVSLNHKGEKIILYDDGSWRYFDAKDPNDIALLEDSDLQEKKEKKAKAKVKSVKPKKDKKKKNSKSKLAKSKSKKKKNSSTATAKKKKPSNSKVAKVKTKKKKKSPKSDLAKSKSQKKKGNSTASTKKKKDSKKKPTTTANYTRTIKREIIKIRDKQLMALEKERLASFASNKYNKELKMAGKQKLSKVKIAKINSKLKSAKLQLKNARAQNKVLLKQRKAYESVLRKEPQARAKAYAKLASKYNKDFQSVPEPTNELVVKDSPIEEYTSETSIETVPTNVNYTASWPDKKPNIYNTNSIACGIAFEGKDSFSGKKRKDLKKNLFFSYTNDKMRQFFEEGDMITCEAYLSSVSGGFKFLCIEVLVASETAQSSYGSIEKGGLLSLKLVDGMNISMYNNKTDYGTIDPLSKTVLYKAQYLINNQDIKTLSKIDIDKVRLVWSTGYEDYIMYETDFLINQLDCLNK